jgi:hypothetical protein
LGAGSPDLILKGIASLEPAGADVGMVAEAIVKVVETPSISKLYGAPREAPVPIAREVLLRW